MIGSGNTLSRLMMPFEMLLSRLLYGEARKQRSSRRSAISVAKAAKVIKKTTNNKVRLLCSEAEAVIGDSLPSFDDRIAL